MPKPAKVMKPTKAWAVVHEDGEIASLEMCGRLPDAIHELNKYEGARIARVLVTEVPSGK